MANGQHISFTSADIERYHRGLMSSKERHAIEKAALDDPFLADALEGYTNTPTFSEDLSELQQRLDKRTAEEKKIVPIVVNKPAFDWWKVAAMIVLVAGAGLLVYQFAFNNQKADIAQSPQKENSIRQQKNESEKVIPPATSDSVSITAEFAKPADENKTGDDQASVKSKKREEIKQATPSAPRIATNPPAKDSVNPDDVAGIVTEKNKEELRSDNTQYKKSVLASERSAADVPIVSPSYSQSGRNVAAAAQKTDDVQRRQTFNQPNIFRGRVTDIYNNALPFSNVTNKEDNIGTYSDANGYFTLTSPDTVLNVQVRSLGFVSDNILLNNKVASNQVHLQEDRSSLAEVVISNKKVNSNRSRNNTMILDEPEPADGWANYDLYLANNLKTPENFKEKQESSQKEVVLSFEVNKSGEPINITVKRSLCESCDKEAIRLLKEGPKWKRKARKGKATVTVSF